MGHPGHRLLLPAAIGKRNRPGTAVPWATVPGSSNKVKQAVNLVGAGALGGAFWGMLIGLLFWMPWLGLAIGAASGALGGALADVGVDDKFIKEVGNTIRHRRGGDWSACSRKVK